MQNESLTVYQSTMNNTYFSYCDNSGIGFGSDPHFGLFIDESLTKGSSHACRTFNNDVLSSQAHFSVARLEVWGFKSKFDL